MKNARIIITTTILFFSTVFLFVACNQSTHTGVLGYTDADGQFTELTNEQVANYLREMVDIDEDVSFRSHTIQEVKNDGNTAYHVLMTSTGGGYNIATQVARGTDGNYTLIDGGKICACESPSATACKPVISVDGCMCSAGGDDCRKISTIAGKGYIAAYFKK